MASIVDDEIGEENSSELALAAIVTLADNKRRWSFPKIHSKKSMQLKAAEILANTDLIRHGFLSDSPSFHFHIEFHKGTGEIQLEEKEGRWTCKAFIDEPELDVQLDQAYRRLRKTVTQPADAWAAPPPDNDDKVDAFTKSGFLDLEDPDPIHNQLGRRGHYSVLDPPTEAKPDDGRPLHTWGDVMRYQAMKKDWLRDPVRHPEWGWERDQLLFGQDDLFGRLDSGELMRRLCVLNGFSTTTLEDLSGINQRVWTRLQNHDADSSYERSHMLPKLLFLLETFIPEGQPLHTHDDSIIQPGQLLGLPTVKWGPEEKEVVDPKLAQKFLKKFGFDEVLLHPEMAGHVVTALEITAQHYLEGHLTARELTGTAQAAVNYLLRGHDKAKLCPAEPPGRSSKLADYLGRRVKDPQPAIEALGRIYPQYADRMAWALKVLPYSEEHPLSGSLSKQDAFTYAKNRARNTGEFLKDYRVARGLSLDDAGQMFGVSIESIRQRENMKQLSASLFAKVLEHPEFLPHQKGVVPPRMEECLKGLNKKKTASFSLAEEDHLIVAALALEAKKYLAGEVAAEELIGVGPRVVKHLLRSLKRAHYAPVGTAEYDQISGYLYATAKDPAPIIALLEKTHPQFVHELAEALPLLPFNKNSPVSAALAPERAYEFARNHAGNVGEFLRNYRLARGVTLEHIAHICDINTHAAGRRERAKHLPEKAIENILETPGFLPRGEDGDPSPAISQYLYALNEAGKPQPKKSPGGSFREEEARRQQRDSAAKHGLMS